MTWNEIASVNGSSGPPLSAVKGSLSSSKATVRTLPGFPPWTSCPSVPYRVRPVMGPLEDGDVELRGFFRLAVEPQTRNDPSDRRHGFSHQFESSSSSCSASVSTRRRSPVSKDRGRRRLKTEELLVFDDFRHLGRHHLFPGGISRTDS